MDQRLLQNPVGFAVAINMHQSHRILWCSLRSWQVHWVHGANVSTEIWLASALTLAGLTVPVMVSARVAWACGRVRDKQMLPPASWCQPRDQRSAISHSDSSVSKLSNTSSGLGSTEGPHNGDTATGSEISLWVRFVLYEGMRSFQTLYRSTGTNIAALGATAAVGSIESRLQSSAVILHHYFCNI